MTATRGGGGSRGRRVLLVSHAPITASPEGWWLTKNRLGMVADGLAELGWDVTVLAVKAPPLSFLTHPLSQKIDVVPLTARPRTLFRVIRLLYESDVALVFMPVVRAAALALVLGRRAVVYAGHAWALLPGTRRWRWALEALVARRAAHVLAAGSAVVDRFARVTPHVSACVPLVPEEVARRLRDGQVEPKTGVRLRVLFVGSIGDRKGVLELALALREIPHLEARLIGPVEDKGLARRVEAEVADLPNVVVTHYLEWPELRDAYRWADVLVLPSRSEGFPRVLYEATAFGAALVVTPVGGVPSLLAANRDALFVPVGDPRAIADALRHLACDRGRRRALAANAQKALARAFPEATPILQFHRQLGEVAAGTS